jgi:hypothetical protein
VRHILSRLTARSLILFPLLLLTASTAWAQSAGTKPIYRIEFKPGESTSVVAGTVKQPAGEGDMHDPGSERYSLRVRGGQTVKLEISSDNDEAIFSLSTPDFEIVEDAGGIKRWSGKLKLSGDYYITVFTRKETSRFKLRVTLR